MLKALLKLSCILIAASTQFTPVAATAKQRSSTTAISTCVTGQADAAVTYAMPADVPSIAREMGLTGTTYVKVDLDPTGAITGASIFSSSGNRALDRAALAATRWSSFSPELRNCSPVGGSYLYAVDFDS